MTRRHMIAVAVAVGAMLLALAPPLWIQVTGDEVALEVAPIDPLSLFRGNYVDLTYDLDFEDPAIAWNAGAYEPVFVVFDTARPANVVRVESSMPQLNAGEVCVVGRARREGSVYFPSLEQFFVTPEDGARIERELSNMVAIIKTTGSCRSILQDLEPQ